MQSVIIRQTFNSQAYNQFDIIDAKTNQKIAYYIEHNMHPIDNTILENTGFEIYYDYDENDEEYTGSAVTESKSEMFEYIGISI